MVLFRLQKIEKKNKVCKMCILDKYQHQPFLEEGVSKVKEVLVVQCVLFLILKIDTLSY